MWAHHLGAVSASIFYMGDLLFPLCFNAMYGRLVFSGASENQSPANIFSEYCKHTLCLGFDSSLFSLFSVRESSTTLCCHVDGAFKSCFTNVLLWLRIPGLNWYLQEFVVCGRAGNYQIICCWLQNFEGTASIQLGQLDVGDFCSASERLRSRVAAA